MPSLSSKDRVSLCRFTFDDGRICRTPRVSTSPDFCFYHAQKEAQFRANEKIGKDLAFFFSGDYLSANDLNTALSRVFVAVARGDIKPRAAHTLAYLAQTMLQTLHLAQNEFISSCGESDWHDSVIKSMEANYDYRFPSPTNSATPQSQALPQTEASSAQAPPQPVTPTPAPAPTVQSAPPPTPSAAVCHPERSEGSRPNPAPPPHACHPERSEGSRLNPASPTTAEPLPASQSIPEPNQATPQALKLSALPATSSQSIPPSPQPRHANPTRSVHFGPNDRLPLDGKPS